VLSFNEPLDSAKAQFPGNYQIVALGGSGSHRPIRVKEAVYNAATQTVTLSPVHRLNLHDLFRLTVIGAGSRSVTDSSGNPLDGGGSGDPGSDFVTILSASDLVLTTTNPVIISGYRRIVSNQAQELNRGTRRFHLEAGA
jgi:hypothetical protein